VAVYAFWRHTYFVQKSIFMFVLCFRAIEAAVLVVLLQAKVVVTYGRFEQIF